MFSPHHLWADPPQFHDPSLVCLSVQAVNVVPFFLLYPTCTLETFFLLFGQKVKMSSPYFTQIHLAQREFTPSPDICNFRKRTASPADFTSRNLNISGELLLKLKLYFFLAFHMLNRYPYSSYKIMKMCHIFLMPRSESKIY